MSFLHNIYGTLLRPGHTFKTLTINYNPSILIQGIMAFFLAHMISQSLDFSEAFSSFINWLIIASLLFLTAYIFVLTGKEYWKLISILAFCQMPIIFLAPIQIFNISNPFLAFILELVIALWVFNLNLIAISQICNIPKRKALLIYLIIPILISFAFVSLLSSLISQIFFVF